MRKLSIGSTRTLLLAALALAAVVIVGSFALLATRDDGAEPGAGEPDGATGPAPLGGGRGAPGKHSPRTKPKDDPGEETDGGPDDETEGGPPIQWHRPRGEADGVRPAEGDDLVVTAETLRAEFAVRHWEEVRRMIDELQGKGEPLPGDVVKQLIDMLAKDDLRLDAVLALGAVKDPLVARSIAELAASKDADVATKQAALDALAKSGQRSIVPQLQEILAAEGVDEGVARHAILAMGGVGGPDATKELLALLQRHGGDDLQNAIVSALGKAKDSDPAMAATARDAVVKGDKETLGNVLVAAQIQGANVGPEMKAELQLLVESDSTLTAFTDEVDRQRMQGAAMPAAVAAGIIEPVLRAATTAGPLRDLALIALRQARGDTAAKQIAAAIQRTSDEAQRRELAVALGETESTAATATLVALLDDGSGNVRRAAAHGLGQVRDPAAVKPILAHLEKAPPDHDFANALIVSLGTIGANEALGTLQKLVKSEDKFWHDLQPFIQNAIVRINTGNPESQLLDSNSTNK